MRKVILVLSTLFMLGATAQAVSPQYVKLNLLGAEGVGGFSFDSRFKEGSKFGYNVGLGYGFQNIKMSSNIYDVMMPMISTTLTSIQPYRAEEGFYSTFLVPFNVYYLVGKKKHFFEPSLGVALFATNFNYLSSDAKIGYFAFAKLGYRYESIKSPLMVSAGVNLNFYTPGSGLKYAASVAPFVSIGYRL